WKTLRRRRRKKRFLSHFLFIFDYIAYVYVDTCMKDAFFWQFGIFWTSSITFQLRLKSFSINHLDISHSLEEIWPMCFGIYMNRSETRYVFVNSSIQELSYEGDLAKALACIIIDCLTRLIDLCCRMVLGLEYILFQEVVQWKAEEMSAFVLLKRGMKVAETLPIEITGLCSLIGDCFILTTILSRIIWPFQLLIATPIHDDMRTPMRDRVWNPYAPMSLLSFDDLSLLLALMIYLYCGRLNLITNGFKVPSSFKNSNVLQESIGAVKPYLRQLIDL
uniref:Uncharacterized protein n=1 Tax=Cucumis melo TaxID=3656 RepID=A0A9I9E700_CUCME